MFKKFDNTSIDWLVALPRLGIDPAFLTYKEGPCPICGGTTRFRFKNKGVGDWFCTQCKGGDGVSLLAKVNNWTLAQTLQELQGKGRELDAFKRTSPVPVLKTVDPVELRKDLQSKWTSATACTSTPVEIYLKRRIPGLMSDWISANIRFATLWYKDDDNKLRGQHPCMLARAVDIDGRPVTLHRTYLTKDGFKAASLGTVKKQMAGIRKLDGDAVRLNRPQAASTTLIVCEGIETGFALVASTQNRFEVWSLLNAGNLAKAQIPKKFKRVVIAADRDPFDEKNGYRPGEHFAAKLAARLMDEGFAVVVRVPDKEGQDFCDLWEEKNKLLAAA